MADQLNDRDVLFALLQTLERRGKTGERTAEEIAAVKKQIEALRSDAERGTSAPPIEGSKTDDGYSFRLGGRHWTIKNDGTVTSAAG